MRRKHGAIAALYVLGSLVAAVEATGELSLAWTLQLPDSPDSVAEYRAACVSSRSARLSLLLSVRRGAEGATREVQLVDISRTGEFESNSTVSNPSDPLIDGHRCVAQGDRGLTIVATARSGALVAVQGKPGSWQPGLLLGSGGYETQVRDLARLRSGKLVAVGARQLRGFVVAFDAAARVVDWDDWRSERPSLVLDVEEGPDGPTICGVEAGEAGELFSADSEIFVASLDAAGSVGRQRRLVGRSCRLLAGSDPGRAVHLLYEGGERAPGPLAWLRLDPSLETVEQRILRDEVFYLSVLRAAETSSSFAVLDQRPARETIAVFASTSGESLGSSRIGVFPTGDMDLVPSDSTFLVISQPLATAGAPRSVRIDAFAERSPR